MLVRRPRRRVDEQIIDFAPEDLAQELAHHGCFLGSAPHNGVAAVAQEEAQAHAAQGAEIGGGGGGVDGDGDPAAGGLGDFCGFEVEEARDGGAG